MTKKIGELLLLLVGAVIVLNLIGSAVAPYMHMIGLTVAGVIIVSLVGGLIYGIYRLMQGGNNSGGWNE